MSLLTTRGTLSQVIDANVRALYDRASEEISTKLFGQELYNEYEPDIPAEQVSAMSGPGAGTLTIEGQQYASNALYKDYPVTVALRKFTSEIAYTEEDIHWLAKQNSSKRMSDFKSMIASHVQALYYNHNDELAKHFYLGFSTTNFTGGDGKALFATDHTIRKNGGTQSNVFASTHLPFSGPNLVTAIDIMNRFQGMNAIQLLPVRRLRVVCALENQSVVEQAITSMYGPLNANLGINAASSEALRNRGIDIASVALPNIPYAYRNYWFLVDLDRAQTRLNKAVAWNPRLADDVRTQNGTRYSDGSTLFGVYSQGWQHVFGSKGDSSAV